VIDTALRQMERLARGGAGHPGQRQCGARQLQQADFVRTCCAQLLGAPGSAPSHLELEVLETSALEDLRTSRRSSRLPRDRVSFALDDFGTGYSSLTYLKRLPVATC
jgi:EAL domain-containing protein (putative c-di-GMP-specific phosphodiesterase class I)